MVLPVNSLIATLVLLASPQNMPPLGDLASDSKQHIISTSDYGARKNHPTAFDDNPSFKGPLRLEQLSSPDAHRQRIRGYYLDDKTLSVSLDTDELPKLGPSTPTGTILKSIVDHLARKDAPVDAKEVAESIEFYLRSGKRLFGASKRILTNNGNDDGTGTRNTITIHDLCSGHGLTGMLFLACNPPGRISKTASVRTVLVDQFEPKSHAILRDCISEICPWVSKDSVTFESVPLEDYASRILDEQKSHSHEESDSRKGSTDAPIIISTHACGSLTDKILQYTIDVQAASVAVMPCCYTGTDAGVPYGLRRMLGVSLSADIRRSYYLQDHDYHVDFAAIPKAITPMNRLILAERRK